MQISAIQDNTYFHSRNLQNTAGDKTRPFLFGYKDRHSEKDRLKTGTISFGFNPAKEVRNIIKYYTARNHAANLVRYLELTNSRENFILRHFSMEQFEGLQYGIKAFNGLTMKEIQYLCENLHVIAVKRGCNNMCGYCYADAKPQKREMSWEDFKQITHGFKTLRKRFHNIDIYGENIPGTKDDPIYHSTELFYDSDCMNLAIKDKKGRVYDFTELASELYNSLGRRTVFDTSGWSKNNSFLQQRAEKYADYFSIPSNMDKLNAFNLSFNVFNASYIASVKALKNGEIEKANKLRNRFTDNMANSLFTFSPVTDSPKFNVLLRCFGSEAKNAKYFDKYALRSLAEEVINKLGSLYRQDLNGEQKYVKTQSDLDFKLQTVLLKMLHVDYALNSVGRMKSFMKEFGINAPMQNHTDSTKAIIEDIKNAGRYHRYTMCRLIDADGKVYHMDYARFIPTEVRLNIPQKDKPSPKLANLVDNFTITKEILNRPEVPVIKSAQKSKK